jgi:hypothetical protein
VEINPADVVSVPDDCSCQKLRACSYKVVGEYEVPLDHNYNNSYSNEDWNDGCGDDGEESFDESDKCGGAICQQSEEDIYQELYDEDLNKLFGGLKIPAPEKETKPDLEAELKQLIESVNLDIKNKLNETAERLRAFSEQINTPQTKPVPTAEQLQKTSKTAIEQLLDALNKLKKQ